MLLRCAPGAACTERTQIFCTNFAHAHEAWRTFFRCASPGTLGAKRPNSALGDAGEVARRVVSLYVIGVGHGGDQPIKTPALSGGSGTSWERGIVVVIVGGVAARGHPAPSAGTGQDRGLKGLFLVGSAVIGVLRGQAPRKVLRRAIDPRPAARAFIVRVTPRAPASREPVEPDRGGGVRPVLRA